MDDVMIVGAGPVGLLLALRLQSLGIRVSVLEQRSLPRVGSRSIGVHPPALERLDELGLGAKFVERGVPVRRGRAFSKGGLIGAVDFGSCAGRHRYVLTIEQGDTEEILREALEKRAPGSVRTGMTALSIEQTARSVRARISDESGRESEEDVGFVVGCDGKHSRCRESIAVPFPGDAYPGSYLMGDAPDATGLGDEAAIFLHDEGLVESFPLPGARRRWVARRSDPSGPLERELASVVADRTGHILDHLENVSAFRAEHFVAERFAVGRVALAGDAAHVVSPIGGQGMNLGWLGACSLATALAESALIGKPAPALERDARRRWRMARAVARRAEVNMWLGAPHTRLVRDNLVRTLLVRPIADGLARLFTMRGLAWGI